MFFGLDPMSIALLMAAGVALDWLFGEVPRWHPLVGFGRYASAIERLCNRGPLRYMKGVLAWSAAVLPPVVGAVLLIRLAAHGNALLAAFGHVVLLYFCIGMRSLRDHMLPIAQALAERDLPQARQLASRIVSRDTGHADEEAIAKAAIESTLENGNDAVFGTLFWFAVAGGPGALLFRLANTLDAMWGYRTERFLSFGWMAARTDDALNWIPARLTAWSYALLGDLTTARRCWKEQAPAWSSPNAGPVMSAGAGSLGLALGGAADYDGVTELRPLLGQGRAPVAADIGRAWQLVARTGALWIGVIVAFAFILEGILHA